MRTTNNELAALPGFFFKPKITEGLQEVFLNQRRMLYHSQGQCSYGEALIAPVDVLDAARIPTHKRFGVELPDSVPLDLREIIETRG